MPEAEPGRSLIELKKKSEEIVRQAGGIVNPDLPALSPARQLRSQDAIVGRMLALYAVLGLIYVLPEPIVAWLEANDLMIYVSPEERRLLAGEITRQEEHILEWSIESLWAFAWMLSLVPELPFTWRAFDAIPEGLPSVLEGESPAAVIARARLRSKGEIMEQLDLYYRLGWWTRQRMECFEVVEHVNYQATMERLKALDWALSLEDWDEVDVRNRS